MAPKTQPAAAISRNEAKSRKVEADKEFSTLSGLPLKECYQAGDLKDFKPEEKLGKPGEFPYTRGVYPNMYRGRGWTMRQFAGFGTPEQTNRRFHYLIEHGQTGLSTAFHFPTLMG